MLKYCGETMFENKGEGLLQAYDPDDAKTNYFKHDPRA